MQGEGGLAARLAAAAQDAGSKASASGREDSLCALGALAGAGSPGAVSALLPALPALLDRHADKVRPAVLAYHCA